MTPEFYQTCLMHPNLGENGTKQLSQIARHQCTNWAEFSASMIDVLLHQITAACEASQHELLDTPLIVALAVSDLSLRNSKTFHRSLIFQMSYI